MYVNPFVAGILATVGVELVVIVIYSLYTTWKGKKK